MAAKSEVSAFRNVRKAATARERCPERPSAEAVRLSRNCGAMGPTSPASDGWSFPLGTNFESFTSFWYFVDGRIRPPPRFALWLDSQQPIPVSQVREPDQKHSRTALSISETSTTLVCVIGADSSAAKAGGGKLSTFSPNARRQVSGNL